jgi:hypothetical protein
MARPKYVKSVPIWASSVAPQCANEKTNNWVPACPEGVDSFTLSDEIEIDACHAGRTGRQPINDLGGANLIGEDEIGQDG